MEICCNFLPVFGCNIAKQDNNLKKRCLLPLPVSEWGIETKVIKNPTRFVSIKLRDFQLLEILNLPGGARCFDSFLKALRFQRRKVFFHMNGSMIQRSSKIPNFLFSKTSPTNCATNHPFKKIFGVPTFHRWRLDILRNIATAIEATTCNWTRELLKFDQRGAAKKHVHLQGLFPLV